MHLHLLGSLAITHPQNFPSSPTESCPHSTATPSVHPQSLAPLPPLASMNWHLEVSCMSGVSDWPQDRVCSTDGCLQYQVEASAVDESAGWARLPC